MKICLLSARFPPQKCGVGDYTYFLGCALARMGHEVEVLTQIGELNESLYPLPPRLRVSRVVDSWGISGLRTVMRALRNLNPDVLLIEYAPHAFHRRGLTLAVNILPVVVRVRSNKRVVTNFHELYVPFQWSLGRNLAALWQRAAAALLAWGSDSLTVVASEWEQRLRRMGARQRIEVIPVGSNIPPAIVSQQDRARLRKALIGESDALLVAAFGSLHDRDVYATLNAFRQLQAEQRAKMVWIGATSPEKTNLGDSLKGLLGADVEWTGLLPHPEVSRLLGACDLMLLPFIDGVSTRRTSVITGFQHGLPVLTTRGAKLEGCYVHGENIYLVPAGEPHALAEGLLQLARSPDLRARIGRGARTLYDKEFAWDLLAEQVSRLALAGPPPSESGAEGKALKRLRDPLRSEANLER